MHWHTYVPVIYFPFPSERSPIDRRHYKFAVASLFPSLFERWLEWTHWDCLKKIKSNARFIKWIFDISKLNPAYLAALKGSSSHHFETQPIIIRQRVLEHFVGQCSGWRWDWYLWEIDCNAVQFCSDLTAAIFKNKKNKNLSPPAIF